MRHDVRGTTYKRGVSRDDTLSSVAILHLEPELRVGGDYVGIIYSHLRVRWKHEFAFFSFAVIIDGLRLGRQRSVIVEGTVSRDRTPGEMAMSTQYSTCDEADPLIWFEDKAWRGESVDRKNESMHPNPVGEIKVDFAVRSNGFGEQETQVDSWPSRLKCLQATRGVQGV